jgi:uncharacterized protein
MFLKLQEMELRKIRFEETLPPGEIQFQEGKLWQAGPINASGTAELLPGSDGEIRIQGTLQATMEAECDRCLEVARFPLDLKFDLYYEPIEAGPEAPEVALGAAESSTDFYDGEDLDLNEVLREQILLALPMQRTCREDCQGICPVCGQNRNRVACACQLKAPDDRWAALRSL